VSVAPFGHSDPFVTNPAADPSSMASLLALPGEPLAQLRLGIGLRIGGDGK
jgi:hypothetical protein